MRIGVVSDTHGYLNPRVVEVLEGVDRILHAGDIGSQEVILGLEAVAPVTAVRGNNDRMGPTAGYPEEQVVTIGGRKLLITHQVKLPKKDTELLPQAFTDRDVDAVVYGHSHIAHQEWRQGILFFNPGAAGKRRFRTVPSVGILNIDGEGINPTVIPL